ncbi:MAG: hypothetical protein ACPGU7_00960 [Gammaproteobacteria bacterium]
MALRIKSRWHESDRNETSQKGLEENAGALAFIAWRIGLERAINLHGEDYVYRSDGQRIAIICEFLAFEIAIVDRMVFDRLSYGDREVFMNALGKRVADHVQDNAKDLFGEGDYRAGFIGTLNERLEEYAKFGFGDGGPAYSFNQFLGTRVLAIMGSDQTNKWSIDQVMDIDANEVYKKIRKAVLDLFAGM